MYDSWLKGDQSEPFNGSAFPDLSEFWPEGSWWSPMVFLKRVALLLLLLLLLGGMALLGVLQDWWEWTSSLCAEVARFIKVSSLKFALRYVAPERCRCAGHHF